MHVSHRTCWVQEVCSRFSGYLPGGWLALTYNLGYKYTPNLTGANGRATGSAVEELRSHFDGLGQSGRRGGCGEPRKKVLLGSSQ